MKKHIWASCLIVPTLALGTYGFAQAPAANADHSSVTKADNSKSNKVDDTNRTATADSQRNDAADLDLAKRIRRSVMDDKSLSTYGHNVKIVAVNGTVTLNGVVNTADEKASIGKKATSIAGEGHVVDQLKLASR
jgi:hyperosmotically inducible periplasmic protein